MQYHAILTLSLSTEQITASSTLTVAPGATRAEIYDGMRNTVIRQMHDDRWLKASTLFFSVEPNALG